MHPKNKKSWPYNNKNPRTPSSKFYRKVLLLFNSAYQVLGNAEKRASYDKLNRDLFSKSQVLSNLKKLTDK